MESYLSLVKKAEEKDKVEKELGVKTPLVFSKVDGVRDILVVPTGSFNMQNFVLGSVDEHSDIVLLKEETEAAIDAFENNKLFIMDGIEYQLGRSNPKYHKFWEAVDKKVKEERERTNNRDFHIRPKLPIIDADKFGYTIPEEILDSSVEYKKSAQNGEEHFDIELEVTNSPRIVDVAVTADDDIEQSLLNSSKTNEKAEVAEIFK